MTFSSLGLGEETVGGKTPSGALSSVVAITGSLRVHPPPVQAYINKASLSISSVIQ